MSTVTPNFNWPVPTSTDLVKDGATAIEALGDSIDASLVDLKGGTTGQVLSKTSNTDMDFTWVAADDTNAIQNTIVDAKGDLIAASAADTPARLAVGSNGETLVADSSTSTGLRYTSNFAAGKNAVLNGKLDIWQRGTSFSNPSNGTYTADRFRCIHDGTGATRTVSQQSFTLGSAPVAGYESQYFIRYAVTAAGTGNTYQGLQIPIEDVRTFAGQTVTLSFWAKADANRSVQTDFYQVFGSGGSSQVQSGVTFFNVTTSWTRYSYQITVPSIAGKTIGTGSYVMPGFYPPAATACTIDIWGVQLEAGSVATAFQTATGTIQGELAACQRYFWRAVNGTGAYVAMGQNYSTTNGLGIIQYPVTMRVGPSVTVSNATHFSQTDSTAGSRQLSAFSADSFTNTSARLTTTCGAFMTAGNATLINSTNASATLDFGAEL